MSHSVRCHSVSVPFPQSPHGAGVLFNDITLIILCRGCLPVFGCEDMVLRYFPYEVPRKTSFTYFGLPHRLRPLGRLRHIFQKALMSNLTEYRLVGVAEITSLKVTPAMFEYTFPAMPSAPSQTRVDLAQLRLLYSRGSWVALIR